MINLRVAPSGPIVAQLGAGFVGRRSVVTGSGVANDGIIQIPNDQSFSYIGSDGSAANAFIAELDECDPAKAYSFAMRMLVDGSQVQSTTSAATLTIEFSIDDGSTWESVALTRMLMVGGTTQQCPTVMGECNADGIAGSTLGVPLGGKILARAGVNGTTSLTPPYSGLLDFRWLSEGSGTARLELSEVLPA